MDPQSPARGRVTVNPGVPEGMSPKHPQYLSDFDSPWCQKIINDPDAKELLIFSAPVVQEGSGGTLFRRTLSTPDTVRATRAFTRPTNNSSGQTVPECVMLFSLGGGLNGYPNTLHGGMNATMLDTLLGYAVSLTAAKAHMTGNLNITYKRPIRTPSVIVGRARCEKLDGRKVFVEGYLGDAEGNILTSAVGVWIRLKGDDPVAAKWAASKI